MYVSKSTDYTIVSDDCWGGFVYQSLGHVYATPFVGTFIIRNCYLKLLKNLKYYLSCPLEFVEYSKYPDINENCKNQFYPIGVLDGDIEIHFYHETDLVEAKDKWNRRIKRINWNNLFIKFSDVNSVHKDYHYQFMTEFEKLEFQRKVCFTSYNYPQLISTVFVPNMIDNGRANFLLTEKKFDIYAWIRQEKGNNLNKYLL